MKIGPSRILIWGVEGFLFVMLWDEFDDWRFLLVGAIFLACQFIFFGKMIKPVSWGPLDYDGKHCLKLGAMCLVVAAVMLGCIRLFFNCVDDEWASIHQGIVTLFQSVCVFDFAALAFGFVYLIVGTVLLILSKLKRSSN